MRSPCLNCYLGDKDKTSPVCLSCEARTLYAECAAYEIDMSRAEIAKAERKINSLIPTEEKIKDIFIATYQPTSQPKPKRQPRKINCKVKLRTFRAFYRTARREGFKDIKDWFNNDYIKHRKSGKYMRDKVGCAQVTLCKMLAIYGAPHPSEHYTYKKLADLDIKRVVKLLKSGCTIKEVADDQGCSAGLISRVSRLQKVYRKAPVWRI